jgi:hypothetical protein
MTFEVFRSVAPSMLIGLGLREDGRSCLPRSLVVRFDVIDVHEHAIDHPGN